MYIYMYIYTIYYFHTIHIFWFTETEALFVQNGLYAHTRTQVVEGQFFIPGQVLQCGGLQLE